MASFEPVRLPAGSQRRTVSASSSGLCLGLMLGLAGSASASDALCFDFSKTVVTTPLKEAAPGPGDVAEQGVGPNNTPWAALRAEVALPIEKVLERMLDHETTRDPVNKELTVERLPSGLYLARHRVRLLVKVFFYDIRWGEDWAYAVAAGTAAKPDTVVISFQKIEGTSHIQRFCGSFVLRRTPKGTEVSQYQEGRITRRVPQEMADSQQMVLRRLRAP